MSISKKESTIEKALVMALFLVVPFLFRSDTPDPVLHLRICAIGILVLFGLLGLAGRGRPFQVLPRGIQMTWWAFILIGVIGIPFAHNAWEGILETGRLIIFSGLLYFFASKFKGHEALLHFSLRCLVGLAVTLGVLGGMQSLGLGMQFIPGGRDMPYATMWSGNFFASAMLLLLPIQFYAAIRFRGPWRLMGILGAILTGWMLLEVRSSATLLALVLLLVLAAYFALVLAVERRYEQGETPIALRPNLRKSLLAIVLLSAIGFAFFTLRPAASAIPRSDLNTTSESGVERLVLWQKSLDMLADHPATGVGVGNWKFHILEHGVSSQYQGFATRYYVRAHNDFIQAFAERGILGGSAFLVFILGALLIGIRQFDDQKGLSDRLLTAMATCGLLSWAVIACFSFPFERPFHLMLLVFFVAVICRSVPLRFKKALRVNWLLYPLLLCTATGCFLAFLTMQSEVDNKALMDAKYRQDWKEVIRIAEEANHWPFEYERQTFTPYNWYSGNAYLNTGRNEQAVAALEGAYRVHPWHPQVMSNLGASLVGVGAYDRAVDVLEKLLSIFPNFHEARMNLTELYLGMGRKSDVINTISHWKAIDFNNEISLYLKSVESRLK